MRKVMLPKPNATVSAPTAERVEDLAVLDATGEWPLVRGCWVNVEPQPSARLGITCPGYTGEVVNIVREVQGPHTGKVLVEIQEQRGNLRVAPVERCRVRKPPAEQDTATQLFGKPDEELAAAPIADGEIA